MRLYTHTGQPDAPLAEFMMDRVRQRHGSKTISDEQLGIMITTVKTHSAADTRVNLFSNFLSGLYPAKSLAAMLQYSKAIDDSKVGPDYSKGADESTEPGLVSLVRCLFVLGQMETCEAVVSSVTKQCRSLAVPMTQAAFKEGMVRTGYAANDIPKVERQWRCDTETSHNAVLKIDFLKIITEHSLLMTMPPEEEGAGDAEHEDNEEGPGEDGDAEAD